MIFFEFYLGFETVPTAIMIIMRFISDSNIKSSKKEQQQKNPQRNQC